MSDLPDAKKKDVATAFRAMHSQCHRAFDPNQYVDVAYVRTRKMVLCGIKDPGQGFSSGEIHHAAINNPSYGPIRHTLFREGQGMRPGGYGLLMTKRPADELVYSEKGSEVLLVKYVPPSLSPTRAEFFRRPVADVGSPQSVIDCNF